MFKAISAFNSFLRTLLSLTLVGMLGFGGWMGYRTYYSKEVAEVALKEKLAELQEKQAEISALKDDLEAKEQRIQRLSMAIQLLKVDHRLAQIAVLKQWKSAETGRLVTRFSFVEVDEEGRPLENARIHEIEGDVLYIDSWVAKFEDEYIEQHEQDPLRTTSICLFRRFFGEHLSPENGFPIDPVGSRPKAYSRGSEMSELEREIWSNFWEYANNLEKARAAGIRAAHGEAPSIQLREGKLYKITLRASDGLSFVPEDLPAVIHFQ